MGRSCDCDSSGSLSTVECTRLIKELGLVPNKSSSKSEVVKLIDSIHGEVTFVKFLELITQIRSLLEIRIGKELKKSFVKWASDVSESMPATSLSWILKDVCVIPKSRKERH